MVNYNLMMQQCGSNEIEDLNGDSRNQRRINANQSTMNQVTNPGQSGPNMYILGQTINTRNTNGSNVGGARQRRLKNAPNTYQGQKRKYDEIPAPSNHKNLEVNNFNAPSEITDGANAETDPHFHA